MLVKHQNLFPATWRHSAPRLRTRLPCCSSAFAPARIHYTAILSGIQSADPDVGWNARFELWIVALRIQRSKLFRPTFDLSLLSTPRSASRRQRSAPPVFAPLPKRVTT